jgi:hypothetical protein
VNYHSGRDHFSQLRCRYRCRDLGESVYPSIIVFRVDISMMLGIIKKTVQVVQKDCFTSTDAFIYFSLPDCLHLREESKVSASLCFAGFLFLVGIRF